jgi:hypothetical protein
MREFNEKLKFVEKLQMRYCTPDCPRRVSKCPVRKAIERYNKSHPNDTIEWCARCNGIFFGWHRVKRGKNIVEIPCYTGGLIEHGGKTKKTRKYDFQSACNCDSGKERQHHVPSYQFEDSADEDKCFQQRRRDYFRQD